MIPYLLKLENFMAFQEAVLDFRSFQIACISGNNGAGKSTLLDALTWVLFQSARAHDSDDLIRIGANEMRVELEFALEGQTYRVIRTRKRKGKGKASGKAGLEFQMLSEEGYRSLTGKKMQETQQRIESTLKMNFPLFVNSSFILQGKADAFTTASPTERKQVLAEILQLDAYEKMRQEAQELRRDLRSRESLLRSQCQRLDEELEALEHLDSHLSDAKTHQSQLISQTERLQEDLQAFAQVEATQLAYKLDIEHNLTRRSELQSEQTQLHHQFQTLSSQLEAMQRWLEHAPQIELNHTRLISAETALLEQEAAFEAYLQLETQYQELKQNLERQLHQLAMQQQKDEHLKQTLQIQLQTLEHELFQAPEIEADYEIWQSLLQHEKRLLEQQSVWLQSRQEIQHLEQRLLTEHQRFEYQLDLMQAQLAEFQELLNQEPGLLSQKAQLADELAQCQERQSKLEWVQNRGLELRHEQDNLHRADQTLTEKLSELQTRKDRLQAHQKSVCPLCERLLTDEDLALLLQKYSLETESAEREKAAIQPQLKQLEQEISKMRTEYLELSKYLKRREGLQTQWGHITTQLTQIQEIKNKKSKIEDKSIILKNEWASLQISLTDQISTHQNHLKELGFDPQYLSQIQLQIRALQGIEARKKELEKASQMAPKLREDLFQAISQAETSAQSLQNFESYKESEISSIQTKLHAISEVPVLRRQLQQEIEGLSQARHRFQKLQEARIRSEGAQNQLLEWQSVLNRNDAQLAEITEKLTQLERAQSDLIPRLTQRQALLEAMDHLHIREKQVHAEIYSLEKERESLIQRRSEQAEQQTQLQQLLYEIQLYDVLEESFGKNGLQAVLIENALPEIEHIANEMLASMSEGRMHIKLQTLRSYKTSDKLAETLDILISDELGTRNYETFSAGEAFRVNFALRLAISKLLARRAGARLQTLVIDEGFGSQDAQGKTRLIEAINAVAPDFATILVITHVDELKALFPCRVEVSKETTGSRLSVLHV